MKEKKRMGKIYDLQHFLKTDEGIKAKIRLAEEEDKRKAEETLKQMLEHISKMFEQTEIKGYKPKYVKIAGRSYIDFESEADGTIYSQEIVAPMSNEEALAMALGFSCNFVQKATFEPIAEIDILD